MNKKILSPVLLAILATSAHAADAVNQGAATVGTANSVVALPPAPTAAQAPSAAPAPAAPTVDCNLHIPSNQTTIDAALITSWASKAALQSFNFSPAMIDSQLEGLKACYTEAGWKGFNDAIQKSGNLDSIKTQQLTVSSQEDGQATINTVKDNQWKIILPMQVVYQNDKEKITQRLNVEVLVGRKATGDLGIMQMIATTRPAEIVDPAVNPTAAPVQSSENPAPVENVTTAPASNEAPPVAPTPEDAPSPEQAPASAPIDHNSAAPASNQ